MSAAHCTISCVSTASLAGNLAVFRLPDVFTFLASARTTGMLTIASSEREAYVFFRGGQIVYAASNQELLRLGSILLRQKMITREQAASIDTAVRSGARFGEIAVEQRILSQEQIDEFLKVQVAEVIYDAFVWREGTFGFYDGFDLPPHAVTISIDLANLIMEGARRIAEWEHCLALLPDAGVVFRVVTDPQTEKITLSLDEWKILFLVNGQRTLEDLCRDVDDEAFSVYRVVYGLFASKLIEPVIGAQPTAEDTIRQPVMNFGSDSTVTDFGDDTNLLVSKEARLSYHDVVKKTLAQLT